MNSKPKTIKRLFACEQFSFMYIILLWDFAHRKRRFKEIKQILTITWKLFSLVILVIVDAQAFVWSMPNLHSVLREVLFDYWLLNWKWQPIPEMITRGCQPSKLVKFQQAKLTCQSNDTHAFHNGIFWKSVINIWQVKYLNLLKYFICIYAKKSSCTQMRAEKNIFCIKNQPKICFLLISHNKHSST